MLTLAHPLPTGDRTGDKLPMPLPGLAALKADLYRSEVSMIAGQPGAGKSALALHLAITIGLPCLYVAADTSRLTMRVRTLSLLTGRTQDECGKGIVDEAGVLRRGAGHIFLCPESSPDIPSIGEHAEAVMEMTGAYPHLIVIDNAIDVDGGGGSSDEWSALRATMKRIKVLARETGAAVLVCHHTSEGVVAKSQTSTDGKPLPPPRSSIQGKVAQLPALVLTVSTDKDTGSMLVGVVKNRHGAASPGGLMNVSLGFDAARMQITNSSVRV